MVDSLVYVIFQIMTDAALLKRQKKEIEELRSKLRVRQRNPPYVAIERDLRIAGHIGCQLQFLQ